MTDVRSELIKRLSQLSEAEIRFLSPMAKVLSVPIIIDLLSTSDFASDEFAERMGIVLRAHHASSSASFSKDKSEHAIKDALAASGMQVELSRRGNPGHDLTVNEQKWSLKTQANAGINSEIIHISKFMELGKGQWETETDLEALRARMFDHMGSYDRIFTLRCLSAAKHWAEKTSYYYELVEIPKALLMKSIEFPCTFALNSTQQPRPGHCRAVDSVTDEVMFELYFDGGTERKLQVRKLRKGLCIVHATWSFQIDEELVESLEQP